jgi:hypothetical protein
VRHIGEAEAKDAIHALELRRSELGVLDKAHVEARIVRAKRNQVSELFDCDLRCSKVSPFRISEKERQVLF